MSSIRTPSDVKTNSTLTRTPVVYLAGGMKGTWQDIVQSKVPGAMFIDPRKHGIKDEAGYTSWDLTGVQMADILFCYMEKNNPGGSGLALEVGYALALGRKIILVEQDGFAQQRYFGMVRAASELVITGEEPLDDGISCLLTALDEMRSTPL